MNRKHPESGNVFFYIFLAIGLLGALSMAISQGSRSTIATLDEDRQRLAANEILAFTDTIGSAVAQLRLRGTPENRLSFATPFLSAGYGTYNNAPRHEVFNPAGGAVVYQRPPDDATTTGSEHYIFLANNAIERIGTTCTNVDGRCSDLILIVSNVRQTVCEQINELLGVVDPVAAPPTDSDINEDDLFVPNPSGSPFGYDETVGDEDTVLSAQPEACFQETADTEYVYYKVLIAR